MRIAGKRVANQVGDILDFSEIDRKHLTSNHDEYVLASVLYDFLEEIRFFIPTNLEVVLDVDSSIPRVMKSDAEKIKKIIRHLVFNSLCFTENGGIFVRFYCVREDYGVNLCIEVRDTGIGMEAIEQERVFEGFYKGDPEHSGRIGGLGLGIPIVQGFVKSLGGFMTMESKPGAGTTVKVCLPQGVVNDEKCLYVENIAELSIGLYFRTEKYSDPHVREFYGITVKNVAMDLGAALHWVDGLDKLRILNDTIKLTHVFIGKEEYEEDREFFEKMTEETVVIVVAHHLYPLPEDSGVMMMKKPFYSLPLIHYLEMKPGEKNESMERLSFKGARVLVVDDEPMNIIVALGIFGRYEIETDMAYSGFEAVEKCTINDYDLIFMDHLMPEMDGIECASKIRTQTGGLSQQTPIVALTANAGPENEKLYRERGFDGYLVKPVSGAALEDELLRLLPQDMVRMTENNPGLLEESMSFMQGGVVKKPVIITTESLALIPSELSDEYDIPLIPYKIRTKDGLFRDGIDIKASGLLAYMEEHSSVSIDPPGLSEHESFFADALAVANNVIHFTASGKVSKSAVSAAREAAASFENVRVVDTGMLCAGEGVLVLRACRMAEKGMRVDEILSMISGLQKRLVNTFIMENLDYMHKSGLVSARSAGLIRSFMAHPILMVNDGRIKLKRFYIGDKETAWRKYIDYMLRDKNRISTEFIEIAHAGFTMAQLDEICRIIREKISFERIYIDVLPATITTATGPGTLGLLYIMKDDV